VHLLREQEKNKHLNIVSFLPSSNSYISTKLFLMFSSDILPKYDCMTFTMRSRNSNTIAALTFCFVTAASQMLERFIWKKLVLAMFVTGERTCWRAWITLTRNASTAFRLKYLNNKWVIYKLFLRYGLYWFKTNDLQIHTHMMKYIQYVSMWLT